jgi:hypothetical protein
MHKMISFPNFRPMESGEEAEEETDEATSDAETAESNTMPLSVSVSSLDQADLLDVMSAESGSDV